MTIRQDTYKVGDAVKWRLSVVAEHCLTWAPDLTKEYTVIEVRDETNPHLQRAAGHTQQIRVSPNYCPYGDKFSGAWFEPVRS